MISLASVSVKGVVRLIIPIHFSAYCFASALAAMTSLPYGSDEGETSHSTFGDVKAAVDVEISLLALVAGIAYELQLVVISDKRPRSLALCLVSVSLPEGSLDLFPRLLLSVDAQTSRIKPR